MPWHTWCRAPYHFFFLPGYSTHDIVVCNIYIPVGFVVTNIETGQKGIISAEARDAFLNK